VTTDFLAAQEYANEAVAQWLDGAEVLDKPTHATVYLWWFYDLRHVDLPDGGIIVDAPEANLEALCDSAWDDAGARARALDIVSSKLIHAYRLTKFEARLAGFALSNRLPKITEKAGRKVAENLDRNMFIYALVHAIRDRFGLKRTRGDAAKNPQSACDVVSMAFIKHQRHEVTYKAVKEIVGNRKLEGFVLFVAREAEESAKRVASRTKNAKAF
jgi:hypothetical protein